MKIGILGGIGPEATNQFYLKLIKKIQKEKYFQTNEDFPQIIINSIPAPELTTIKINKQELTQYKKGLEELDSMTPDFILICCNTIHQYFNYLTCNIKTPIINLLDEIYNTIPKDNTPIGIIGTPTTTNKLYNFKNINLIKPTKNEIIILSNAIINYNSGKNRQIQKNKVKKIIQNIFKKGKTNIILLGCTELEIMFSKEKFQKIEPLEILANTTVKKIRTLKKTKDVNI